MKIAVVTINWNGLKDTIACVDSLLDSTYKDLSIIVVDNGSKNNEGDELINTFGGKITLLRNAKNLGFAGGANTGIRYALTMNPRPDYILLVDNDATVDKECINTLLNVAVERKVWVVGAAVYAYGNNDQLLFSDDTTSSNLWRDVILPTRLIFKKKYNRVNYAEIVPVDHVSFWCSLMKIEVFEKVGLFDEEYFWGWEDIDFCKRITDAGVVMLHVPFAKIFHRARAAGRKDGSLQYYSCRNKFILMKRFTSWQEYYLFVLYMVFLHLPMALVYHIFIGRSMKDLKGFLRGLIDGLIYRRKLSADKKS